MARIEQAFSIGMEELHGEVNALQIPALDRQVTGVGSSTTEHHRVELLAEFGCWHMDAYGGVRDKLHPFFGHQVDAPLHDDFVELHVGNTIHEQTTDAVGALVHGHPVAGAIQLRSTGKS